MADILSIGVSGLSVSQSALTTTGNNITNANTSGYSRQRVDIAPQPQQYVGVGYIGSGAKISGVGRIVDQFYISQLRSDTATYHELDVTATQLNQLDSLLADQSTGLSPALQQLFSDFQQASQDPTSLPTRQVVLSDLSSLSQRFNTLYGQLQAQSQTVNQSFDSLATQATGIAQNIAKLNQSIVDQGGATGTPPNSLLDQRDELLRKLSEIVGVKTVTQSDGMINVFIGSGQPLVIGNRANTLSTAPSSTDPSQNTIQLSAGAASTNITSLITGGKLGGLVAFQNGALNTAYNSLGRVAISLADAVNQQNQRGLDLNGNTGGNLFTDINSPSAVSSRVLPSSSNTGSATLAVAIANPSALTTSDYRLSVTAAGYQLTYADGSALNPPINGALPLPAAITTNEGFNIQISGAALPGDIFMIRPTRLGAQAISVAAQTPQELAFAQPIRTDTSTTNRGSGTISQGIMVPEYGAVTAGMSFNVASPLTKTLSVQFISPTAYQIVDGATTYNGTIAPGQNNVIQINDSSNANAPVYQFTIAGTPSAGDQFTIAPNTNSLGTSDNRNALALADLSLTKVIGGSQSLSDAYGLMVSDIGSKTASVKNNRDAADTLLTQSQANRDSVSAVNLDEEAANLIKYQQAYQASAQVIGIARSLFTSLLSAFQ